MRNHKSITTKKLPIGISTFSEIIKGNYYYVDKTHFVYQLFEQGKYYFLSRPRGFGKTLFIDTLRQTFWGNKELFKGLYIENKWDWTKKWPIVFISLGGGVIQDENDLKLKLNYILEYNAQKHNLSFQYNTIRERFNELIHKLKQKNNQSVVILIDEYDRPVWDNISYKNKAEQIRKDLKNFYSVIKDNDAYIRFCFITGVGNFSRNSLFQGLNNIEDITLSNSFSSICGYTEQELISTFPKNLSQNISDLQAWYNGYNFNGEKVYNPFNILLYCKKQSFDNYWSETANPKLLIKLLKEKQYYIPNLENLEVSKEMLSNFDTDNILIETLLFQTGYLSIKKEEWLGKRRVYHLTYPNIEVKLSLSDYILSNYVKDIPAKSCAQSALYRAITKGNVYEIRKALFALFSAISNDWYKNNNIDHYKGYYASVFYLCCASIGFDLIVEDITHHGKIDLTLFNNKKIYIFKFKVNEIEKDKNKAIEQIKAKKYYEKYLNKAKDLYLIGIDFSKRKRNIVGFEWEKC